MLQTTANPVQPVWQHLYGRAIEALPNVAASLLVLGAGVVLGIVIGRVAGRLLRRSAFAKGVAEWGSVAPLQAMGTADGVALAAAAVRWFVIFCSTIVALYMLDARLASSLAERVLLYVPHFGGAVLILAVGLLLARFFARSVLIAAVNHEMGQPRLLSGLTRGMITLVTVAIALEHAGIGERTVLVAFGVLFGGITLAAAIAVGVGMQDLVRQWLIEQVQESRRPRKPESLHHV